MHATAALTQPKSNSLFTVRHAWMLSAALICSGILAQVMVLPEGHKRNDFAHYYLAAKILLRGENPYTVPLKPLCEEFGFEYDERIPYGANPPLLIRGFTLLAWMPPRIAYGCWIAIEFALLLLLLEGTRRIVGWQLNEVTWWLFVGLVLNSTALQSHTYYAQMQLLVAAALMVAFAARLNGRHFVACSLVALAAGFKIYPAVLLPWFVLSQADGNKERIYRSIFATGALGLVLFVTGPAAWMSFARDGLPVIQADACVSSHTNYSIQALLVNVLPATFESLGMEHPLKLAATAARSISLLVILATYLLIWRKQLTCQAAFCLLVVVMILCSPVAWSHYMILMVLPAAILFRTSAAEESYRLRWLAFVVAALSVMPDLDGSFFPRGGTAADWAVHYYPLYTLAIAAGLFTWPPTFAPLKRKIELSQYSMPENRSTSVA